MSLPKSSPTQSYWQTPPHRLATYRSSFPSSGDVVIIGSGITGVNIARTLFEQAPYLRVIILDARELCGGATGRNGGHCNPSAYHHWSHRAEMYGIAEAISISRFETAHPAAFRALADKYNLHGDIRELEAVDAYYDRELFDRAKTAALTISKYIPEIVHHFYTAKEAQDKFLLSGVCVGAITYRVGQLDSYNIVTQIAEILVNNSVNLQTQTPVTEVEYDLTTQKWRVETPRGSILAGQVVHATNGYIKYLVPSFSTVIKPSRGHVTAQIPPKSLSISPLGRAFCFIYAHGEFDYLTQQHPCNGGKLILGGGYYEDPQPYTDDDSEISESVGTYLRNQLREVVQWGDAMDPEGRENMLWSGIMGFSADELPWVGPLPEKLGGGDGQWVCGGYTGEGMCSALLCAEALALMILGEESPDYFPRSFLSTVERFERAIEIARVQEGEEYKSCKL